MKMRQEDGHERRPYDPPVVKRQSNLKSITLFTSFTSDSNEQGKSDRKTSAGY
jgi:hypothetical protein